MSFLCTHPGYGLIALGVLCLIALLLICLLSGQPDSQPQIVPSADQWQDDLSPLELFEEGRWLACANAIMVSLTDLGDNRIAYDAIGDRGLLRELLLLEAGVGSQGTLPDLRDEIEEIQAALTHERACVIDAAEEIL
jgi:hypothetical protein